MLVGLTGQLVDTRVIKLVTRGDTFDILEEIKDIQVPVKVNQKKKSTKQKNFFFRNLLRILFRIEKDFNSLRLFIPSLRTGSLFIVGPSQIVMSPIVDKNRSIFDERVFGANVSTSKLIVLTLNGILTLTQTGDE